MNEYKRLTKRRGNGVCYSTEKYEITCYPMNNNLSEVDKIAVRLCELEDKIEDGTLVELPCKVSDTLYKICPQGKNAKMGVIPCQRCPWENCQCFDIGYQKDMENIIQPIKMKSVQFIFSIKPYIGKIWFADKEEAEKALAERKEK